MRLSPWFWAHLAGVVLGLAVFALTVRPIVALAIGALGMLRGVF